LYFQEEVSISIGNLLVVRMMSRKIVINEQMETEMEIVQLADKSHFISKNRKLYK